MKKTHLSYLAWAFLLPVSLMPSACSKTTMVSGRVLNVVSKKPIPNLALTLVVADGHSPRDSSNPAWGAQSSVRTDENGEFTLEISERGVDAARLDIGSGYCYTLFGARFSERIQPNKRVETTIEIDPIDGKLRLVLQNASGQSNALYVQVDCDVLDNGKGAACCRYNFENKVALGKSDTISFPVTAGRFVPVYWGTSAFSNWDAPRIDSVFCTPGKDTYHVIKF